MAKFILKHPIITEKSTANAETGKYVFLVEKGATKQEIGKAVTEAYKVKVDRVHVINTRPKTRHFGRSVGVRAGYRKAIVTLVAGQKLDILPQ
ncbi:MAG: 50S ribosomal protein L23 [Patescibacteria group bacterium]